MNRKISNLGLSLIKHFEGFKAQPYICPAGYPTIGYGHVIKRGENFTYLTEPEASELLRKDVRQFELGVIRLINVPLEDYQFDALVSFSYNLGLGALQRSTLRMKLNRDEYEDAADEFLKWCRAGGRILPGLLRRRKLERLLFLGKIEEVENILFQKRG